MPTLKGPQSGSLSLLPLLVARGIGVLAALASTGCLAGIGSQMPDDVGRYKLRGSYRTASGEEVHRPSGSNSGVGMTFGATLFGGRGGAPGHVGTAIGAFGHLDLTYVRSVFGASLSGGYGMEGGGDGTGGDGTVHSGVRGWFVRPLLILQLTPGVALRGGVGFVTGTRRFNDGTEHSADGSVLRPELGFDVALRRGTGGWDFFLRPSIAYTKGSEISQPGLTIPGYESITAGGAIVITD